MLFLRLNWKMVRKMINEITNESHPVLHQHLLFLAFGESIGTCVEEKFYKHDITLYTEILNTNDSAKVIPDELQGCWLYNYPCSYEYGVEDMQEIIFQRAKEIEILTKKWIPIEE